MSVARITPIQPQKTQKPNYLKITGYSAVVCAAASIASAKTKHIKAHKNLAYLSGVFTLAHIGIIEWFNIKRKHNKK